jgi:hypothetical protein
MGLAMNHGKVLLMGVTGTVQGRLGWAHDTILDIFNEYEPIITKCDWLCDQKFSCVHYVIRFGADRIEKIEMRKSRKYSELTVASQLSMSELHEVFLNRPVLHEYIENEVRRVLRHIKSKYGLSPIPELDI